jgi:hypothetical protein
MVPYTISPTTKPRKTRVYLTPTQRAELLSRYIAGELYRVLAADYGIDSSSITYIAKQSGLTLRRAVQNDEIAFARKRCESERAQRPVPTPHFRPQTIRTRLNEMAFDTLTPESAYWIGFLMADGSIVEHKGRKTLVFHLSQPDMYQVQNFKRFLQSDSKITLIPGGRTSQGVVAGPQSRICICSNRIIAMLEQFGQVPRQTYTARARFVEMHPDFWRGVIDGDGSVPKSARTDVSACGSRPLMEQFAEFIRTIYPAAKVGFRKHMLSDIYVVRLFGKTAAIVLDCLYNNDGPCLVRKKENALFRLHKFSLIN